LDLVKYSQLKPNSPTCPFCGREIPLPRFYSQEPYLGVECFTTYKTECKNCRKEIELVLDKDINLVQICVTPFGIDSRWHM